MKTFSVGIRVDGSKWLTYTRIKGNSIEQKSYNTIVVDEVEIEFGEVIENIITD